MADLRDEIEAFQRMQGDLEAQHHNRWVLIHNGELVGVFDSFESAADDAVHRFGRGPFLIRQVGVSPSPLPISIVHAWPNVEG